MEANVVAVRMVVFARVVVELAHRERGLGVRGGGLAAGGHLVFGEDPVVVAVRGRAGADAALALDGADVLGGDGAGGVAEGELGVPGDGFVAERIVDEDEGGLLLAVLDVEVDAVLGENALEEGEVGLVV